MTTPRMKDPSWRTPQGLWDQLHAEYRFDLDAAASLDNTKRSWFFDGSTPARDGLKSPWLAADGHPARRKGLDERSRGVFSVFLVPMSSSVGWFNDLVVPYAEWHTFRPRIAFIDPAPGHTRKNPKQDNLLVVYDPRSARVGHAAVRDAKTGMILWRRGPT
jgi:hypothetical protein